MKAKTEAERRYDAAKANLAASEKAVREAEMITTGHPGKIETKRRRLRDLKNTSYHGTYEQNDRANRDQKIRDLELDIAKLERELEDAKAALSDARATTQANRREESSAAAAFTIERDRQAMENDAQRTELAIRGQELAEQKFAQTEKAAAEAAKTKLEEARISGASAERIAQLEREFKAASQRFEWEQTFELENVRIDAELAKLDRATSGQIDLAQLQGQIAEESAKLHHAQNLETIEANTQADVTRIRTTAEEHRKNVTHEVNEDIRKAFEMLSIRAEQAFSETMNAMKLMVLKHQLDKNFATHKAKLDREGRSSDLAELAADYQTATNWIDQQKPD